ncbi:MAG: hypothetical protein Q9170_004688 [Blastenia crenularia]
MKRINNDEGQSSFSRERLADEENQTGVLEHQETRKEREEGWSHTWREALKRVERVERERGMKDFPIERIIPRESSGLENTDALTIFSEHFLNNDEDQIGPYAVSQWSQKVWGEKERVARVERKRGMKNRFIAAIVGGLSIIVPMLVMAIHPSQLKTLVTAGVAVLLLAVGLAWKSSAQVEVLLGTTAAYAAVIVVFVGVNSN